MSCQQRLFCLLVSLTIALVCLSRSAFASVLAIDYGTEFTKASVIKPGVPFDVLLNRDSKRKIQSSVAWKGEDRLFGSDAFNIAARFPGDSFTYLKLLQGVPFESESVNLFHGVSPAQLVRTSRGTAGVVQATNGTEWTVEELIAMQFSYIKDLAESVGGDTREPVRDVVVAVPSYYTQFERDAVADALEIAGLRLAALVNDGTAVALNFAMSRTFDTKEWHVIYDAGAGGVKATVVSFETVQSNGKRGKDATQTQITAAGVGYDRSAGGLELDRRLRDMLALDFEVKHKQPINSDARGMAKLWKEAGRIKTILSANNEAMVSVESLAFDIDYRTKVSRTAFETACSDLKPKFAQPILDAIANAGITLDEVKSVILTGGHSRTPMVQSSIKSAVGESKIATSVNADEAAVLGAALFGASISPQFRTKDIKVTDILPYDIQISYLSQPKIVNAEDAQIPLTPRTLHSLVFPEGSKTGSKKTMTFKRKDDFNVTMSYKTPPGYGFPTDLLEAEISGVKEALEELTEAGAIDPVVKATLALSESGFAGIQDAIAYGEIKKDQSFAGKIKGLFGGSKDDVKDESASDSSSETTSETTSSTSEETESVQPSSQLSSSPAASPSSSTEKKKEARETIPLKLTVKPLSIPAMTPMEIRRSRDRLIAVDTAEAAKRRREEARNGLEAYLYRMRDLLEGEDGEMGPSPFKKCSKEEERDVIQQTVYDTLHWMNEEADHAQLIDFWEKKDALERLERPIQFRYKEIEAFPSTLNESQRVNWMTRIFLTEARKNLTAEQIPGNLPALHTSEELMTLEKSLREHESWLHEWVEKQKRVKPYEDPVILTTEMKARAKTLENALLKLMRRKTPPKRKMASSTTTTGTETESSTSSGADNQSTEDVPPPPPPVDATSSSSSESATGGTTNPQSPHDEL